MRLRNKTAVVTGGGSGLGLACARRFVAEGARVLLCGRDERRLATAAADLGDAAMTRVADVRSRQDMAALAETARQAWGRVDALVANAGLGRFGPLEADGVLDPEQYDLQFDVNVRGVFHTVQAFLPLLDRGGSVILVASVVNPKGLATTSVYSATKAAVRSLGRVLAAELGPRGVRVNCLSPGYVPTEFQANSGRPAEAMEAAAASIQAATPLGRLGRPEDVAAAALFLASDDSAFISGVDLPVDGGWVSV